MKVKQINVFFFVCYLNVGDILWNYFYMEAQINNCPQITFID